MKNSLKLLVVEQKNKKNLTEFGHIIYALSVGM